jgi:WD40 repeat protein
VAFSPDGQHLATAAANGVVHLWELPLAQLAKQ